MSHSISLCIPRISIPNTLKSTFASNLTRKYCCNEFGRSSARISVETSTILTQSFQANSGTVPRLCNNHFSLNPFQFAIRLSSYHPTLRSFDTEKASLNNPRKILLFKYRVQRRYWDFYLRLSRVTNDSS
jgi:hypothetical protein